MCFVNNYVNKNYEKLYLLGKERLSVLQISSSFWIALSNPFTPISLIIIIHHIFSCEGRVFFSKINILKYLGINFSFKFFAYQRGNNYILFLLAICSKLAYSHARSKLSKNRRGNRTSEIRLSLLHLSK